MEANASKHASKRVHACARARARARGLMAALPGGGPAEDGSELRSHACGVAKVETRGRVPGVGRIVVVTPREVQERGGRHFQRTIRAGLLTTTRERSLKSIAWRTGEGG